MILDDQLILREFEKVKELDSRTFVEIPQREIIQPLHYRQWLVEQVEQKWMREFNQENKYYFSHNSFGEEDGIGGYFGGVYLGHTKFYRYDGTERAFSEDDYRAKRGFLIRDHYSERDVVKVQLITDNLLEFLRQEKIEQIRRNFQRRV